MVRPNERPLVDASGFIELLEALYRWEVSEEDWLRGLCDPLLAVVPSGLWVQANTFDVSDYTFKCPTLVTHRAPPMLAEHFRRESAYFTPEIIARCYYGTSVSTVHARPAAVKHETGAGGVVCVKGLDPSGRSVGMNVGVPECRPLNGDTLDLLRRIAGHLSSASRVRRRIAAGPAGSTAPMSGADAIFSAKGGRLVHAEGPAKERRPREQLAQALHGREAARSRTKRKQSLEAWRPLVDTRWTLVDTYESDGTRFIVARENRMEAASLDALTVRERQVVACLAFGQTTKEIAYALGVDASTVRVLLKRAAARLGVRGRAGLLDHSAVKTMRGGIDAAELAKLRSSEGTPH